MSVLISKTNLMASLCTVKIIWKPKSHADEVTDFYDKTISRLNSNHHSYYPQVFLKEFK